MTAINIISVGVNCPELTSPKASWQTEGTVEIHSFHSLGRGYRFFTVQGSSKEASPHYQSSIGYVFNQTENGLVSFHTENI